MHETQTAPHDPFRKLATAIIAQAVRDYTAPKPHDTGHKSVETRVKNWQINRMSADFFLFRDNEPNGKWAICCYLIRIAPDVARNDMLENKDDLPAIVKRLKGLDNSNDK